MNKAKYKPIYKELFSSRRIYRVLAICCGLSMILGIVMTVWAFISYANDEETFRELAQEARIRQGGQQDEAQDTDETIIIAGSDHTGRTEKENENPGHNPHPHPCRDCASGALLRCGIRTDARGRRRAKTGRRRFRSRGNRQRTEPTLYRPGGHEIHSERDVARIR